VFGRRISVWEDVASQAATQRWTVYDGQNPYADFNSNGSLTNRYMYGLKMDQLFGRANADGSAQWYLTDRLGSVRALVNDTGTLLDQIVYDSFGQILSETNTSAGDRFKYTAREWDGLFGEYYYRRRYYGADTGRFESIDPKGFAARDSNLYRYVANSPTNLRDPSGLDFWDWLANDVIGTNNVNGWNSTLGNQQNGWFAEFSNFGSGWGDVVSFGGTVVIRDLGGFNTVNNESGWNQAGQVCGFINVVLITKKGGGGAAGGGGGGGGGGRIDLIEQQIKIIDDIVRGRGGLGPLP
jgi:RHS repeat-associated protein